MLGLVVASAKTTPSVALARYLALLVKLPPLGLEKLQTALAERNEYTRQSAADPASCHSFGNIFGCSSQEGYKRHYLLLPYDPAKQAGHQNP